MSDLDDLEIIADRMKADVPTDTRLSPKGQAACRVGALTVLDRARTNRRTRLAAAVRSDAARRCKKISVTLAPVSILTDDAFHGGE